jgi:adenylosuccinate synthase
METLRRQGVEISPDNLFISGGAHLTLPGYVLEGIKKEKGIRAQGTTKSGIAEVYAAKAARDGVRVEAINRDPNELLEITFDNLRAQRSWLGKITSWGENHDYQVAEDYVKAAKLLGEYVTDTALFLNNKLRQKHNPAWVLAEAAQGFLLDLDQGMYPYTTSSSTTAGGVCSGLGIHTSYVRHVTGVAKAVQSHVGGGPFITEIKDPTLQDQVHGDMDATDAERGTTTGRLRRLGYLDLPQLRRAQMINGNEKDQDMALTKLDWVSRFGSEVKICTAYIRKGKKIDIAPDAAYKLEQSMPIYVELPNWQEDISDVRKFADLPFNAQQYVEFIEKNTGIHISKIGVGQRRDQVIVR